MRAGEKPRNQGFESVMGKQRGQRQLMRSAAASPGEIRVGGCLLWKRRQGGSGCLFQQVQARHQVAGDKPLETPLFQAIVRVSRLDLPTRGFRVSVPGFEI